MLEILKRIYRQFRRFLVNCYMNLSCIFKHMSWFISLRKNDINNIGSIYNFNYIKPIHVKNWHYGTRFFLLKSHERKVFVKVLSNRDLAYRELDFYSYIYKSDSKLKSYIPRLIHCNEVGKNYYMILEYIEGFNFIDINFEKYTEENRKNICCSLFEILTELNNLGLLHNDIRMNNIILRNNQPVLFDFGYSCNKNDLSKMLNELSSEERELLNEHNRIAVDNHNDAFSMFYIMKSVNPSMIFNQFDLWKKVNEMINSSIAI